MSHESGITTSDDLRQFIATAKSGIVRSFKVIISNEKMELGGQYSSKSTLEIDFNQSVALYVDATKPCYIMMRLDSKNSDDIYHWLLILFCPDHAQTAEKMKYASTRSSFKRQFGSHLITSELFFDTKAEVNYQAYQDHIRSKEFPVALTDLEKFALEAEKDDNQFYSADSTAITLPKISLDSDLAVNKAFDDIYKNKCNYVQLGIDVETQKNCYFLHQEYCIRTNRVDHSTK
uniref:Twinfilin-2 (Trinotate prediction) n=1 Tax=Myxobolus squamalis TaxID=59785 RepID=A0A6B2FXC8_MYXSQ